MIIGYPLSLVVKLGSSGERKDWERGGNTREEESREGRDGNGGGEGGLLGFSWRITGETSLFAVGGVGHEPFEHAFVAEHKLTEVLDHTGPLGAEIRNGFDDQIQSRVGQSVCRW